MSAVSRETNVMDAERDALLVRLAAAEKRASEAEKRARLAEATACAYPKLKEGTTGHDNVQACGECDTCLFLLKSRKA